MRIYVACLASYNAGKQHGTWIDIEGLDADDIKSEIAEMLRESPCPNTTCDCPECDGEGCADCQETGKVPTAEEWAIHDYEGLPTIKEYANLEFLVRYAEVYEEHEEAFEVWWENERNEDFDVSDFEEQYQGTFRSLADYAEDFMDSIGGLDEIPENLRSYFDFEAWGRDCELGGDIWTCEGGKGIYVFLNH